MKQLPLATIAMVLTLGASAVSAAPRVSHHGGPILHCNPPQFFDQKPAKNAEVDAVRDFSFIASEDTDSSTIKVWANNEPVAIKVTQQRSGSYLVEGQLKESVNQGKVWFRASAEANDGCDENSAWNVYINK